MKKNISKAILTVLSIVFFLGITSCQGGVYYGIMHDVAPEAATINGNITSIARCNIAGKEYLFLSTGGTLYYKGIDSSKHGEWNSYEAIPFSPHHYNYFATETETEGHQGEYVFRVIADKDYIYLLTASFKPDTDYGIVLPETFRMWVKPLANFLTSTTGENKGWTNITAGKEDTFYKNVYNSEEGEYETYFSIFSTNSVQNQNRKAYFRVQTPGTATIDYYQLNGTSAPSKLSNPTASNYVKTNDSSTKINSAFVIGSITYFTDAHVVCTNETASAAATKACLAGITISDDGEYDSTADIYTFAGGSAKPAKLMTAGSAVASLAFTADSLLIGKGSYTSTYTNDGGIERICITDGNLQDKTSDFTNNATYQFTSSYILPVLICADPSKKEEAACLYATVTYRGSDSSSSASTKDVGLWAYYPARGNWNRE
ncbi:MAG: hypothetical protein IK102_00645 [Treponema sp.]|nr:hypothetical protein [Treponema sp.]